MKRLGILAIKVACLAALAAGVAWNLRLAAADLVARRHQAGSLRQAIRIMPVNGAYAAQLADEVYASDPPFARSLLQRAVALNPYDAPSWIQLGLLDEAANNMAAAEHALLQAAEVDATFLPSWSLANYYFRRQNPTRFWYWAQRAAHIAPDDATPLFRLAWFVSPSVPVIENRLQLQRPMIESQFVSFLITQGDPLAVSQAAAHLLDSSNHGITQPILRACDWLIAAKRPGLALPLWNGLAERHQLAYAPVNPDDTITNGLFAHSPTALGFDWHMPAVEGVSSFLNTGPNALGFELSGEEPDQFVLLDQTAPVRAEKNYTLQVDYDTDGIPAGSGLAWTIQNALTGAILARTASLSAGQGGTATACFAAPANSAFIDLSLNYQRQPGTMRPAGKLTLKQVKLSPAASLGCGG